MVLAKPKPTKVDRPKRKDGLFCKCKYLYANRADHKICAKCRRPVREKDVRKVLDILLNEIVKKIVLLRDGFCVTPAPANGHSAVRQPGHLVSRQKKAVKWDLYNVNEQCSNCNARHEQPGQWIYYDTWFIRKFGEAERLRLDTDAQERSDLSVADMEELLRQLTEIHLLQLEDKAFKPYFTQKQILTGEWRKA